VAELRRDVLHRVGAQALHSLPEVRRQLWEAKLEFDGLWGFVRKLSWGAGIGRFSRTGPCGQRQDVAHLQASYANCTMTLCAPTGNVRAQRAAAFLHANSSAKGM